MITMTAMGERTVGRQLAGLKLDSGSKSTNCLPDKTNSSPQNDSNCTSRDSSKSRIDSTSSIGSTTSTRSAMSNSDSTTSIDSLDDHTHAFKQSRRYINHFDTEKLNQEINQEINHNISDEDDLINILNKNLNLNDNQIQLIIKNLPDLSIIHENLSINLSLDSTNIINGNKKAIESFMYKLSSLKIEFEPVYKSNEGLIVFIKNISPQLIIPTVENDFNIDKSIILDDRNPFFDYINQLTYFKSLQEIKLFIKVAPPSSSFCILKFSNHLDSNHLMENLSSVQSQPGFKNQFNKNKEIPIYANKYINRILNNGTHKFNCDTLVLSNLSNFLPESLTLYQFKNFIMKFKFFAPIDTIYFPIINDQLNVGFIKFKKNLPNLTEICLRILLNLNNIDWKNFHSIDFSLFNDEFSEFELNPVGLQIDFAQQKHNHHLLKNLNSIYLGLPLAIYYPNPWLQISNFSQSINYQETNLYVINIAQIFDNNNQLWLKFWSQFGEVNSAKLINRNHGENKRLNDDDKKIGFVFYKNLNSALKALLKTNGKTISFPDSTSLTIQSSFAIQKSQSYKFAEFDYYRNTYVPPMPMRTTLSSDKDMELGYLFDEINSWLAHTYNQN